MSSRLLKLAAGLITFLVAGSALACSAAMKDANSGQGSSAQASAPSSTVKN